MSHVPIRWKLDEVLERHNITGYRLIKESGLAGSTIYRITTGKTDGVQGKVLDRILSTLYRLTGERFSVCDVLEWEPVEGEDRP